MFGRRLRRLAQQYRMRGFCSTSRASVPSLGTKEPEHAVVVELL